MRLDGKIVSSCVHSVVINYLSQDFLLNVCYNCGHGKSKKTSQF